LVDGKKISKEVSGKAVKKAKKAAKKSSVAMMTVKIPKGTSERSASSV
jgi:hypothetical protein